MRVLVTATNVDGVQRAPSAASASVQGSPPANNSAPAISGSAQRASTLIATAGAWTGFANAYRYQWQRSADGFTWTDIDGQTANNYTLAVADENSQVRVIVTATNPDGSASTPSVATPLIPAAPPVNTTSAGDHRLAPANGDAVRRPGDLERDRQRLHLPVAALRRRHYVDGRERGDRAHLRPRHGRREPARARDCHRDQPRRQRRRAERAHVDGAVGAAGHDRVADHHGNRAAHEHADHHERDLVRARQPLFVPVATLGRRRL